jgi:cytidyltransferase-like protein
MTVARLITGRFQPFHNGHLEYAVEASAGADLLVVGLTNVLREQSVVIADVPAHRLRDDSNPLSDAERALVALEALRADSRLTCEVAATLVPIEQPHLVPSCVPSSWEVALTLHEPWNERKKAIFEELGYRVVVVCADSSKDFQGSEIRRLIRNDDDAWRALVPVGVARAMDNLGITARLSGTHV